MCFIIAKLLRSASNKKATKSYFMADFFILIVNCELVH